MVATAQAAQTAHASSLALIMMLPLAAGLHVGPARVQSQESTSPSTWEFCASPEMDQAPGALSIPRIVHQTYKNATLPPRLQIYRDSWRHVLPDWEHRLWLDEDNRNLVKEHYPWFLATYDSYDQNIKRVDAARLFMMHHFGGIYADTDVEVIQNPTPLFSSRNDLFFFAQNDIRCGPGARVQVPQTQATVGAIPNALMASVPGHPFWIYLAMKLVNARREGLVMWATGPSRLTEALAAYQVDYPHAKVAIFAKDYWAPFKWGGNACERPDDCRALFPDAYLISHWTGTWNHCEKGTCLQDDAMQSHYSHAADSLKF